VAWEEGEAARGGTRGGRQGGAELVGGMARQQSRFGAWGPGGEPGGGKAVTRERVHSLRYAQLERGVQKVAKGLETVPAG
jgi:hypothetical protein